MDPSELPTGKPSPRKELQGPRPAPLRIRKDSYMVKKPPMAPHPQHVMPPPQRRAPVIIYTVSPKVIHTNPNDFMTLVQRLTGSSSSTTTSSSSSSLTTTTTTTATTFTGHGSVPISPAARLATIENIRHPRGEKPMTTVDSDFMQQLDHISATLNRSSSFNGILSPVPSSLPPISPYFFSPSTDPNSLSFLHDLSPLFNMNKNYIDGNFIPTPTTFLSTPTLPSPTPFWDLFNYFPDL